MSERKMSCLNIDSTVYRKLTKCADDQRRCIRYVGEEILEVGILILTPIFEELHAQREQMERGHSEQAERISALETQLWRQTEQGSVLERRLSEFAERVSVLESNEPRLTDKISA